METAAPSTPVPATDHHPERTRVWPDRISLLARWILGGVFIWMGWNKLADPVAFLKLVRDYQVVAGPPALNLIAATLPAVEIFFGALLLLGIGVRGSALTIGLLLAGFTALIVRRALAIHQGEGIPFCDIRFDCGCGSGEVWICGKLAENALLLLAAFLTLVRPCRRLAIRYQITP